MNTQAMPALASALSGVLPQEAVRSLMQALGNCNQPVTQRGGVNVQASRRLPNGLESNRTWNAYDYADILPYAGQDPLAGRPGSKTVLPNTPGHSNGDWNTTNYFSSFSFPTNNEFNNNNLFRNVTNNYGGDSYFESVTVNNLYVGPPGAPGRDGRDGAAGAAGAPGAPGGGSGGGGSGGGGLGPFPLPFATIKYVTNVKTSINFTRKKLGKIELLYEVFNPGTCEMEPKSTSVRVKLEDVTSDNPAEEDSLVVTGGYLINQVDTAFAKTIL